MTTRKSSKSRTNIRTKGLGIDEQTQVCFVISPIGIEGSDRHKRFKEVLEYLIIPAVKNSGFTLKVIRADDIERSGSFIKDILSSLLDSFVVIADLTEQNPNVFYELGVRHALSPRTILIAQSMEEIPSDLREYRAIVYETTLQGAAVFTKRLTKYLKQIFQEPHRSDNPVLDRLHSIIEEKTLRLENENIELKKQITTLLTKGVPEAKSNVEEPAQKRAERILKIFDARRDYTGTFYREMKEGKEWYHLPPNEGNFDLFIAFDGETVSDYIYVSIREHMSDLERELADVRVLLNLCSTGQGVECQFIIVTNDDLSKQTGKAVLAFKKMKMFLKPADRELFSLEIWDKNGLLKKERELGIKIDLG